MILGRYWSDGSPDSRRLFASISKRPIITFSLPRFHSRSLLPFLRFSPPPPHPTHLLFSPLRLSYARVSVSFKKQTRLLPLHFPIIIFLSLSLSLFSFLFFFANRTRDRGKERERKKTEKKEEGKRQVEEETKSKTGRENRISSLSFVSLVMPTVAVISGRFLI